MCVRVSSRLLCDPPPVRVQVVTLQSKQNTCVGTPWYTAPEVIMVEPYTLSADVWSLGCCVLEMATGRRPFHACNSVQALFRMVEDPHPPLPTLPDGTLDAAVIPVDMHDFLMQVCAPVGCVCVCPSRGTVRVRVCVLPGQCWVRKPTDRPTVEALLTHPFMARHVHANDAEHSS